MADGGVMREFLMRLGYQVDAASEAKFKAAAKESSALMDGLARAATTAALATAAAVTKMASELNGLFNASRRIGGSADNVKAFGYAVKQAGGSADAAVSSLETLAAKMRESPGWAQKLESMGVRTTDAFGNARDTVEVMLDLGDRLAAMPMWQAKAEANVLGIDEHTLLAMRSGEVRRWFDDSIASSRQLGVSLEDSARKARAFWQELNRLWEDFSNVALSSAAAIAEKLTPAIQWAHEALHKLAEEFDKLDPELKETIKTASAAGGAFLALAGILAGAKFVGAITGATGLLAALAKAGAVAAAGAGGWALGTYLNGKINQAVAWATDGRESSLGGWLYGATHDEPGAGGSTQIAATSGNAPRGIRNNNPGNLNFAGQAGATLEGPGGRFAKFQSAEDGLRAMARQLKRYANAGYSSIRSIINKWAPSSENNSEAYVRAVSQALGMDANASLNLSDPGVMSRLMSAIVQHENGQNPYSREQFAMAAAYGAQHQGRFGGGTVTQTNNITVNGATDPQATADAVVDGLRRPTSTLQRDLSVAAR